MKSLIITKKHDSTYGIDTTILPVNLRNYVNRSYKYLHIIKQNIGYQEEEIWRQLQSQLNCLGLKIKKRMILKVTFYPFRFWKCKRGFTLRR